MLCIEDVALFNKLIDQAEFKRAFADEANSYLKGVPIDILCFGSAGVGKSALLKALTSIDFHPTDTQAHGTKKLTIVEKMLHGSAMKIRVCDTTGVNLRAASFWQRLLWAQSDIDVLLREIRQNNVKPICVLYCTSMNSRADPAVAKQILSQFKPQCPIFWVITNMCAFQDQQFNHHLAESIAHMRTLTDKEPIPVDKAEYAFSFGRSALVAVNSEPFVSHFRGSEPIPAINITTLRDLIRASLDGDNLLRFVVLLSHQPEQWQSIWELLKEHREEIAIVVEGVAAIAAIIIEAIAKTRAI